MAQKIYTLPAVTISTAGTPVPLTTNAGIIGTSIIIAADKANTGKIYLGGVGVSSANGQELDPGDTFEIVADSLNGRNQEIFLSEIYLDTETNNNIARIQYLRYK